MDKALFLDILTHLYHVCDDGIGTRCNSTTHCCCCKYYYKKRCMLLHLKSTIDLLSDLLPDDEKKGE